MAVNIGGSAISDIIAPAAKNDLPNTPPPAALNENGAKMPSWKIDRPNSAITMSGVPATISMLDSTTRASQVGRPYSAIQIALAHGQRHREHDADQRSGAPCRSAGPGSRPTAALRGADRRAARTTGSGAGTGSRDSPCRRRSPPRSGTARCPAAQASPAPADRSSASSAARSAARPLCIGGPAAPGCVGAQSALIRAPGTCAAAA